MSDSDSDGWLAMEVEEQQRQQAAYGGPDPHLEEIQRLMDLAEEEDAARGYYQEDEEEEEKMAPPQPRYNPVALLMKLPADLRAFVKTFWTNIRQPFHVNIQRDLFWGGVVGGLYVSAGFLVTGRDNAPDRFTVTRSVTMRKDDGEMETTMTTLIDQSADQVGNLVANEWIKTFMIINNLPRTSHKINLKSYDCCPKHDKPMTLAWCIDSVLLERGQHVYGRKKVTEGRRHVCEFCTDAVARMLTHWTACSDNMDHLPLEVDPSWSQ